MIVKRLNISIFPNIIFGLYIILSIVQYILGSNIIRERYFVICFLPLMVLFFRKIPTDIKNYVVLLTILIAVGSIFSFINQGYKAFLYLVYTLIHISLVILLFKHKISEYIPLFILYIFSIYVLYQSTILKNISDIFPESSRNYISWIGLSLCSLYYMLSLLNEKKPKGPFPIFILIIICIMAEGRSGIITSILFFLCYLTFN